MTADEQMRDAVSAQLARLSEASAPHSAKRRYQSFVEVDVEASEFFDAETVERLGAVKDKVDPHGMFRANHPIGSPRTVTAG